MRSSINCLVFNGQNYVTVRSDVRRYRYVGVFRTHGRYNRISRRLFGPMMKMPEWYTDDYIDAACCNLNREDYARDKYSEFSLVGFANL